MAKLFFENIDSADKRWLGVILAHMIQHKDKNIEAAIRLKKLPIGSLLTYGVLYNIPEAQRFIERYGFAVYIYFKTDPKQVLVNYKSIPIEEQDTLSVSQHDNEYDAAVSANDEAVDKKHEKEKAVKKHTSFLQTYKSKIKDRGQESIINGKEVDTASSNEEEHFSTEKEPLSQSSKEIINENDNDEEGRELSTENNTSSLWSYQFEQDADNDNDDIGQEGISDDVSNEQQLQKNETLEEDDYMANESGTNNELGETNIDDASIASNPATLDVQHLQSEEQEETSLMDIIIELSNQNADNEKEEILALWRGTEGFSKVLALVNNFSALTGLPLHKGIIEALKYLDIDALKREAEHSTYHRALYVIRLSAERMTNTYISDKEQELAMFDITEEDIEMVRQGGSVAKALRIMLGG